MSHKNVNSQTKAKSLQPKTVWHSGSEKRTRTGRTKGAIRMRNGFNRWKSEILINCNDNTQGNQFVIRCAYMYANMVSAGIFRVKYKDILHDSHHQQIARCALDFRILCVNVKEKTRAQNVCNTDKLVSSLVLTKKNMCLEL